MPDPTPNTSRVTLRTLRKWVRERTPFAMLTCYDATTARVLWDAGVRGMLVGDTAAQVILGHDTTLPAPMDFMVQITAAVRRGAPGAFVMADAPFGSYQCGDDEAVRNAVRFLVEGAADAVKFEVDATFTPLVGRLSHAGVPVVAHLGSRPQQVRAQGGYRAAGRTRDEARQIVTTAQDMIAAGVSMLLLEAVPAEVSQQVVEVATPAQVPVVGCGAGNACHGHVVVLHDLLGLTPWQPPFAPPMANLTEQIGQAAKRWVDKVASGEYLKSDHPYHLQ